MKKSKSHGIEATTEFHDAQEPDEAHHPNKTKNGKHSDAFHIITEKGKDPCFYHHDEDQRCVKHIRPVTEPTRASPMHADSDLHGEDYAEN
mmetsp:Transcript_10532/g.18866  ORF Transcript_10532/g.18866 Transcript_10532/m.18866 type:complete len:91 (-) Transcript_10532:72-344(-)